VFGFFNSHDQVRSLKVIFLHPDGIAVPRRQGDSSICKPGDRVVINRAVIDHVEPQPPGFGSPAKVTGGCQGIEVELGEPAAVVIGGAEEEDRAHVLLAHALILPGPGSGASACRHFQRPKPSQGRFFASRRQEGVNPCRRHSSTCKGLKLTVQVEYTAEGDISPQEIEELKVALRELGMDDEVRSRESRRDLVCNPAIGPIGSETPGGRPGLMAGGPASTAGMLPPASPPALFGAFRGREPSSARNVRQIEPEKSADLAYIGRWAQMFHFLLQYILEEGKLGRWQWRMVFVAAASATNPDVAVP
jgi:hypothetical protein